MAMEEYLLILKFTGFLILVALLAYFMIRFGLRRLQPSTGRGYIKVLQKVPLDVKGDRLLVLVRIEERILLLGSAQGNITVLQDFPAEALSLANGNPVQPETENLFSRLLAACRERVKSEKEGAGL
jgi:flagellar biogenesis protein FliO